jgi:hypothetical protein
LYYEIVINDCRSASQSIEIYEILLAKNSKDSALWEEGKTPLKQ